MESLVDNIGNNYISLKLRLSLSKFGNVNTLNGNMNVSVNMMNNNNVNDEFNLLPIECLIILVGRASEIIVTHIKKKK